MAERVNTLIIGAGVVGAAVAYALRGQAEDTFILEAAARAGTGTTSRNSGVIHAGLYYPPQSLKTRLCRRGAELLYAFAAEHGIPHRRTGKYIVANNPEEEAFLTWLKANVQDVPLHETEAIPSGIRAAKALFSPNTGIVDIHLFVDGLLEASGVEALYHQKVDRIRLMDEKVLVAIGDEHYLADRVINCAGLAATDFSAGFRHYFARGAYFQVQLPKDVEVPHLVYPAVPKGSPSLGIHLTRNIHGEAYLGPDIEWIETESYRVEESRLASFFEAAKTYLPWLEINHLQPGYAGIRPKLSPHAFSDFTILFEGNRGQLIHCLGIESPGITAAMAIGEYIQQRIQAA